ncbi:hypothetical protein CPC08DRAFT_683862 [Agrocybe pediades]|nr:hypothetical protein CPC08DRAFT_683862 [Agrocybe pediades]
MIIIFYDVSANVPGKAWSSNTWKIRYALNYKGLPFKTEWVALPDVEEQCKKVGIKPTGKAAWNPEKDYYTLPAIHDTSTGVRLADSIKIAKYLDETYPDTPRIFPDPASVGLQLAFADAYSTKMSPAVFLGFFAGLSKLDERTVEYLRQTREKKWGKTMEEMVPTGEKLVQEWEKLTKSLDKFDKWYGETDDKGPFMMGDVVSWADFVVGAQMMWMTIMWGEESEEWKRVASLNNGRWDGLLKSLEKYAARH